jgi:hypothetical protein
MLLDQVADPEGTRIVSPLAAAFTQSSTSCRPALAAVRVGLDPEQAARAGSANAQTASRRHAVRTSLVSRPCWCGVFWGTGIINVVVIVVLSHAVSRVCACLDTC